MSYHTFWARSQLGTVRCLSCLPYLSHPSCYCMSIPTIICIMVHPIKYTVHSSQFFGVIPFLQRVEPLLLRIANIQYVYSPACSRAPLPLRSTTIRDSRLLAPFPRLKPVEGAGADAPAEAKIRRSSIVRVPGSISYAVIGSGSAHQGEERIRWCGGVTRLDPTPVAS